MRAKRRRIKGERKWRILRLLSIISLIISLTSGTVGILFIPSEKNRTDQYTGHSVFGVPCPVLYLPVPYSEYGVALD